MSDDMTRDMPKDDAGEIDITKDLEDLPKDLSTDSPTDMKVDHVKVDGDINDLKTCTTICQEANATCDGMYNHFAEGLVGGIIKHEEVSGGLECDELPTAETELLGKTYKISSYHCYCITMSN